MEAEVPEEKFLNYQQLNVTPISPIPYNEIKLFLPESLYIPDFSPFCPFPDPYDENEVAGVVSVKVESRALDDRSESKSSLFAVCVLVVPSSLRLDRREEIGGQRSTNRGFLSPRWRVASASASEDPLRGRGSSSSTLGSRARASMPSIPGSPTFMPLIISAILPA